MKALLPTLSAQDSLEEAGFGLSSQRQDGRPVMESATPDRPAIAKIERF